VHEVIQHAVEEAQTAQPNVRIDVKLAGPASIALWDPTRVGQLLSNLLSNAVQHGNASDAVELKAAVSDDAAQIEISNRLLAPMAAELLEHLFDPFQKGRASKGLGLGLHIVREIARAHGGVVHATAREQTITFHVGLPLGT
jgi:signal transduction histidine kinase